ncbi:MAG: addiction module protein [Methylacidiphilales bacterium]|nr:addiction module protein [Candidatus Methylacidiphilales bacterium]
MSVNELLEEVLHLPPSSRASLVEKIVESIAADIDPAVERSHLDAIEKKRLQAAAGQGSIMPGDDVLKRARSLLQE